MRDGALIARGLGNKDWNCSAPHGAGRLLTRNEAKKNLSINEYVKSMSGIYSSCVNSTTIDESPQAYKDSEQIAFFLQNTAKIINKIKPIYNFKTQG